MTADAGGPLPSGGGELRRRLVHVSGAAVPLAHVLAPGIVTWPVVAYVCLAGTALAVVLEALRLGGRVEWRIFDELTRDYEADNPAGYALYAVGYAAVAVGLGPGVSPTTWPLAVPAMLMLAVGDPISGLLGSAGAEGIKDTTVLAVMFAVCLGVALPFVPPLAAAAGAAVATVADGVKPVVWGYVVDDNLTIPVGGGVAMLAALVAV